MHYEYETLCPSGVIQCDFISDYGLYRVCICIGFVARTSAGVIGNMAEELPYNLACGVPNGPGCCPSGKDAGE